MINVSMKSGEPLDKNSLLSINNKKVQGSVTSGALAGLNSGNSSGNAGFSGPTPNQYGAPPMNSGCQGGAYSSGNAGFSGPTPNQYGAPPMNSGYQGGAYSSGNAGFSGPTPNQYGVPPMNSGCQGGVYSSGSTGASSTVPPVNATINRPTPPLQNPIRKGQKVGLNGVGGASRIKVCLGWNTKNSSCDVDVSAFLLNTSGKVIGDTWFVFYGQTQSPDHSTQFYADDPVDREFITVDFSRLNHDVSKIVFVLTINEALEKHLNFSMLCDAYIRIIDMSSNAELVSFQLTDYYSNVTSMMLGEIYLHNGSWKFNAIGNGVTRDLAGLCQLYGVQVV